jgi:hypothetical protein
VSRGVRGERSLTWRGRSIGLLGPFASSFTLAWLATHRGRLYSLLLGGKRLSLLVIYDSHGKRIVQRDDREIDAIKTIVWGSAASKETT